MVRDMFPKLLPRIQQGRPDWNDLFDVWADMYQRYGGHIKKIRHKFAYLSTNAKFGTQVVWHVGNV